MKQVNKIAEAALSASATNSTASPERASSAKDPLPDHWTAALFKRWQVRYHHKWTSAIEGVEKLAIREWSEGLAGYTPEMIQRGLNTWVGDWPPSLPEFQQACIGKVGKNEFGLDYVPEYHRAKPVIRNKARLLSSDARDAHREAGLKKIGEIRKMVNSLK